MVASVDTHIFFQDLSAFAALRAQFESRQGPGGGRVVTAPLAGDVVRGVDAARNDVGGVPLGVVAISESDALEAIVAGADDAAVISGVDEVAITVFLDRVRTRANARKEGERRQRDFVHAEKLAALGSVVAGVAHEVNNPLSTITLAFDVLRGNFLSDLTTACALRDALSARNLPADEVRARLLSLRSDSQDAANLLDDMIGATEAVAELVRDLRVFSRSDAGERSVRFHPQSVIDQALRLVRRELGPKTLVEFDLERSLPDLFLPRNRLAQVVTNLLLNAVQATREVNRDIHRIRIGARVDEQHLALSISDTGPGIPEDTLEKIFDPFFTTKREGQGTGLGLSISRSIVQHMGGDLVVSSTDGSGATFVCFLPLPDEAIEESSQRRRSPLPEIPEFKHMPAVLLIDEDARVLRVTTRILQEKFKVLIARDGREATELLASGSHADAVVSELALPEMDGVDFYHWAKVHEPRLAERIVFLTAAQERPRYAAFLEEHRVPLIYKPAARVQLLSVVADVILDDGPKNVGKDAQQSSR